jgi:nitrogen fixation protein NifU and related proteins
MARQNPYDDLVMDHIKNARNYRALDGADRRSHGSNPLCGDEVDVFLRMDRDRIADAAFQCSCCGISMASASMMTESVRGLSVAEAHDRIRALVALIDAQPDGTKEGADEIERALLATVREFPARKRCAALPWITLEAALANRSEAAFS